MPTPPSLIASLLAGFDATTSHIALIVFPIVLDLFVWLGPHFKITTLINTFNQQLVELATSASGQPQDLLQANQDMWKFLAGRINLLMFLRTYPVGIPSLMSGRLPLDAPIGKPLVWDIRSFLAVVGIWLLLSLLGLVLGSLYFIVVADASTAGKISWQQVLKTWPRVSLNTILLTLLWCVLIVGVSIPASCILSALAFGSLTLGRLGLLLYGGILLWVIFPLLFSPHGIFVNRNNVFESVRRGVRVTRMTLPSTGLFFLIVFVLSQGMDILWRVPPENSWFTLVGLAGHAFVTTGLLASSFVYYRESDLWIQRMLAYWNKAPQAHPNA